MCQRGYPTDKMPFLTDRMPIYDKNGTKKMKTADKSLEPKIRYLFLISEDCGYLSKTTRFRKESLWCSRKRRNPLTQ